MRIRSLSIITGWSPVNNRNFGKDNWRIKEVDEKTVNTKQTKYFLRAGIVEEFKKKELTKKKVRELGEENKLHCDNSLDLHMTAISQALGQLANLSIPTQVRKDRAERPRRTELGEIGININFGSNSGGNSNKNFDGNPKRNDKEVEDNTNDKRE